MLLFNKKYSIFLLIIIFSLFSTIYNATIPLHIDEAYYWVWSRHLQTGYFDHPPMIAYMIHLFSFLGDSEWAVRSVTVFCMSGAMYFIYLLTLKLSNIDTALKAAIIFLVIPVTQMGYTITTPDSPLILFWAGSLYFSYNAVMDKKVIDFIYAGIFIGCMMLSKYTSILFVGSLLIYLVLFKRELFLHRGFWLSMLIAFLILSPMLWWNYQNDWISFNFQYTHGTSETLAIKWNKFFEFFGGMFLLFSPVFMVVVLLLQFKDSSFFKNKKLLFVNLFFLIPLLFFLYKGLFKKMQLNWAAPAFVAAAIIVALYIEKFGLKKSFRWGIAVALLFSMLIKFPALFYLPPHLNIHYKLFGYKEAAHFIEKIKEDSDRVYADHLTRASILSYYLPSHPYVSIPTLSRISQYTLWDKNQKTDLASGIYLSKDERIKELKKVFKDAYLIKKFRAEKEGLKPKDFYIYRVLN